ncbi:MAG: phosphomethylpyrimidine synthase ThiC, partial [Desulfobacteraceae bacterium]|nr:phosphomethylpyrimidine synthase ThiC [Desulfobacteraceae bacterium]
MTQLKQARSGATTPEMEAVALKEHVNVEWLRDQVAEGRVVIPANPRHNRLVPCGIGEGLFVKVNANIGTSSDKSVLEDEVAKLRVSLEAGADAIMDLSTGRQIDVCRKNILEESTIPVGTVPIYQAVVETVEEKGGLVD